MLGESLKWRSSVFILLFLVGSSIGQTATTSRIAVSSAVASSHLLERLEPTVPPIAKTTKVGGTVKLQITIARSGEVLTAKVLSGHPFLVQAAVDAVRKWRYRPFEDNGSPVEAITEVEVSFPSGMLVSERETRDKFFPVLDECRKLINNSKFGDAEKKCREAVALSDLLPRDVILERTSARSLLANAIFLQRRYAEAIQLYEEALNMDRSYRKPDDADLASDYWNLGRAIAMSGDLSKADAFYTTAIQTFEAAIVSLPSMKENYTRRLKRAIDEFAQLKEAEGQSDAAAELKRRSAVLE